MRKVKRLTNPLGHNLDDELRQQLLAYGQRYDFQTGLLNYQTFRESLADRIREGPAGQQVALIWIDILNMRNEFALRGWTGAEKLVRSVAETLRSSVDAHALLGRFSGRCILVALPAAKLEKADRRRIQEVVDALLPLRMIGAETQPEVAAGVAFYPADAASADDLVRFAGMAASRAGYVKSRAVLAFNASMNEMVIHDHLLEVEMNKGLGQDQFRVFYQPEVDLGTGLVLGAEALMRWNHPEWGLVSPSEFIAVAERSDLIHRIFDLGLRTALKEVQQLRELGLALPSISVNASAANVRGSNFTRSVRAILAEIPIAPAELELEVTESMLLDDEGLFRTRVRQLKAIGVRIAIDDFGTRYTGFNVLKHLPLNTMKIDRCFIHGIDSSKDMRALCQTIVAMARQLKMRTVAEGIEGRGELEVLKQIGCDAGQGYLFQRPVPEAEFAKFLREWPEQRRALGYWTTRAIEPFCGIA
jgi:EAL domain-containing protein (putative c-di-GMP-specific phosphodiesterase class I)/GGDEF domain-containing protein